MSPKPAIDLPRALRRVVVWSMLAGLAIGLPLQALSSTLAGMLGPRHVHQAVPSSSSHDPMIGWTDFRRANYEHRAGARPVATAGASTHRHAHETGLRHRHDPDDIDVVDLEAPAEGDGALTGSSPSGAAFTPAADAGRLEPSPQPVVDADKGWRTAVARSSAMPFPRRIERPPSHA
jgi:hypothetical protein